jgi:MYXO-CTERM domain-containing protein
MRKAKQLLWMLGAIGVCLPSAWAAYASCVPSDRPPIWSWPAPDGVASTTDRLWFQPYSIQQIAELRLDGEVVTATPDSEGVWSLDPVGEGSHTLTLDVGDLTGDGVAEVYDWSFRVEEAERPALPPATPTILGAVLRESPFSGGPPDPCTARALWTDCYDTGPLFELVLDVDPAPYAGWPAESLLWTTSWEFAPGTVERVCVPGPCPPEAVPMGGDCAPRALFGYGGPDGASGCATVVVRTPDGQTSAPSEPWCIVNGLPVGSSGDAGVPSESDAGDVGAGAEPLEEEVGCAAAQGGRPSSAWMLMGVALALAWRRRRERVVAR